jgi:AcrR family transcriptional regulator
VSQIIAAEGLRERKRQATHARIADEAARLAAQKGVAATTIDEIAAAAQVGRATFFRYFDAKEVAVAEGFSVPWLQLLIDNLDAQPVHLDAMTAVVETFRGFAPVLDDAGAQLVLQQAKMAVASPALQAWTLHVYVRFEQAIAASVAARFDDLAPDDPRPQLVGALTMSAVRICLDTWLASDGSKDLPSLLQCALGSVAFTATGAPR